MMPPSAYPSLGMSANPPPAAKKDGFVQIFVVAIKNKPESARDAGFHKIPSLISNRPVAYPEHLTLIYLLSSPPIKNGATLLPNRSS